MTLPARYFSWRIRGNALSWAMAHKTQLLAKPWDAIIATSMVDLSTLKGLVPELAAIPTLLYFHENQFVYPKNSRGCDLDKKQIEPQMVTLYGAVAADQVVFNSHYNKMTFLRGVEALLKKLPDHVPQNIVDNIDKKANVLPVPLEPDCYSKSAKTLRNGGGPLTIVWNHRWEYDKGPELLLSIVQLLSDLAPALDLKFHIVGQQFRQTPKSFSFLHELLIQRGWLGEWGYLASERYREVLRAGDVVLSTALHDFQGLALTCEID